MSYSESYFVFLHFSSKYWIANEISCLRLFPYCAKCLGCFQTALLSFPLNKKAGTQAFSGTQDPKVMLSHTVQKDCRLALIMKTIRNNYQIKNKMACALFRTEPCSTLFKKKKRKKQVGLFLEMNGFSPSYSTHAILGNF